MGKYVLILFMLWFSIAVLAQKNNIEQERIVAEITEKIIEQGLTGIDYAEIYDQLYAFYIKPLNLNTSSAEQLRLLYFLSEAEINAIINHRNQYGNYLNLYELQTIELLSPLQILYLTYFVSVDGDVLDDNRNFKQLSKALKHQLLLQAETTLEQRAGYANVPNGFKGNPHQYVIRYRGISSNRLHWGYSAEKDMGEPFTQTAFDFHSMHFWYKPNHTYLKVIAIGDYQLHFGQGLTLSNSIANRKSAYVLQTNRSVETIRPYKSLNENQFFRGFALQVKLKKTALTVFGSHKFLSASVDETAVDESFQTIQLSGLHRTQNEINQKHKLVESMGGFHVKQQHKNLSIGITVAQFGYNKTNQTSGNPYQTLHPTGSSFNNTGFNFNYQKGNCTFFGEVAQSNFNALAGVTGLLASVDKRLDVTLVYRHYAPNYYALYSNAFAEYADNRNETGLYTGLNFKLNSKFNVACYVDFFKSNWLRYMVNGPSVGSDFLCDVQYTPVKNVQFNARYQQQHKQLNVQANPIDVPVLVIKKLLRFNLIYKPTDQLVNKARVEFCLINQAEKGYMLFEELAYQFRHTKFNLSGRIAYFNVSSYVARIYATETDLPLNYTIPAYYQNGVRTYLLIRYRIYKKMDVGFKFSRTNFANQSVISSGLNQINGNILTEVKIQLSYQW